MPDDGSGPVGASDESLHRFPACNTIVCMNVDRLSITMDPALGEAARKAAKRANLSVSAWIAEATADRLRNEALKDALIHWQSGDGSFTPSELAAAETALNSPAGRGSRSTTSRRSGR